VRFLEQLGRVRANDITLTDSTGKVLYRSPPSTYKVGREAPDWFAALVVPQPSHQIIELPGGRMTIDAEPSRAVLDGWDEVVTLAAIGAGGLLVINVLVFWAVGRALRPFSQIVAALDRLKAGDFGVTLPALPGREAAAIGGAFNRMAAVLQENIASGQRAFEAERRLSDSRELAGLIETHIETERREIARACTTSWAVGHGDPQPGAVGGASLRGRRCRGGAGRGRDRRRGRRLYDAMHRMIPRLAPMELRLWAWARRWPNCWSGRAPRTRRWPSSTTCGPAAGAGTGHDAGRLPHRAGRAHECAAACVRAPGARAAGARARLPRGAGAGRRRGAARRLVPARPFRPALAGRTGRCRGRRTGLVAAAEGGAELCARLPLAPALAEAA
jgi:two-component system sensor histidine kinase UhpB